jgi:hypothetical protein
LLPFFLLIITFQLPTNQDDEDQLDNMERSDALELRVIMYKQCYD